MGLRSCDIQLVFFFKQKTAYEMRISDWSSDVCSSDLPLTFDEGNGLVMIGHLHAVERPHEAFHIDRQVDVERAPRRANVGIDRQSVVEGKSVSVRVDFGGRRVITQKTKPLRVWIIMYYTYINSL